MYNKTYRLELSTLSLLLLYPQASLLRETCVSSSPFAFVIQSRNNLKKNKSIVSICTLAEKGITSSGKEAKEKEKKTG